MIEFYGVSDMEDDGFRGGSHGAGDENANRWTLDKSNLETELGGATYVPATVEIAPSPYLWG